eukprot:gene30839-35878_t
MYSASALVRIRGLDPSLAHSYSNMHGIFNCLDHSKKIPYSQVNDNYCDCPDGSDEPGTSACANGIFFCLNRGYVPITLSASFVDDGICDCCDGADEAPGKCRNSCLDKSLVFREELRNDVLIMRQALVEKTKQVGLSGARRAQWVDRLSKIDAEVEEKRVKLISAFESQARVEESFRQQATPPAAIQDRTPEATPEAETAEDTPSVGSSEQQPVPSASLQEAGKQSQKQDQEKLSMKREPAVDEAPGAPRDYGVDAFR